MRAVETGSTSVGTSGVGAHRLRGEHRQITALFYDIVGSTPLMARMEAEQFRDLLHQVHVRAAAAIRANHGYLEHVLGDGGVAYFGYPEATEDAAQNAVSAALAIVAESRRQPGNAGSTPKVLLRVGIATGQVILTNAADVNLPSRDEIIGYAPTLAARIQTIAGENDIAVSDETYRITRRAFDYESLGKHLLKGFPEAMNAWRPVAAKASDSRFLGTRDPTLPFQSRHDEVALAQDRWRDAASGHGQFLYAQGEPGIGKSRFLHEIQQSIGIGLADTHLFQFTETGQGKPLGPILNWARSIKSGTGAGLKGRVLLDRDDLASTDRSPSTALCAELVRLMSDPDADPNNQVAADELRQRAITAASRAILSTAVDNPQLLIFEDVHWADGMSKDVIDALIGTMGDTRVLACASTRGQDLDRLDRRTNVSILRLGRLDLAATTDLVASIWHNAPVPEGLAGFIHEQSEGIPLFAEEMTRLLREKLPKGRGTPRAWTAALGREGVATLKDLLDARLAAVGPARWTAQVASVIGRDFDRDLLAAVMHSETDRAKLDRSIDKLTDAGIFERPLLGRGHTLRFRHVLLRDAAYGSLLNRDRKALHAAIARYLLRQGDQLAGAELDLANHFERAGEFASAVGYFLRAARYAAAHSALDEAGSILTRATGLLPQISDPTARRDLQLGIAAAQGPIVALLEGKASDHAQGLYSDAIALCDQLEPSGRTAWFPIYWGWWYTAPDVGQQHRRAKTILDVFAGSNADQESRLQAFHCAWAASYHVGDHATCRNAINRGLTLYDPGPAQASRNLYGGHDSKVCGLGELAQTEWCAGRAMDGRAAMAAAMRWSDEIDHLGSRCHALDMKCLMLFYQRDYAQLEAAATEMKALANRHQLPGLAAKARIYAGWTGAVGNSEKASLRDLHDGLAALQEIETEEDFPLFMGMIGEAEIAAGSASKALAVLRDAVGRAKRSSNLVWLAELERLTAVARKNLGEAPSEYVADAQRAIGVAKEQGAKMLALRALNTLIRLDRSAAGLDGALRAAIAGIQESIDLAEAERLLAELT